jgi:hypothetical protein
MGDLFEIRKNNQGFGILVEKDAGSIDINDEKNIETLKTINSLNNEASVKMTDRLTVYAVFQKYGIENANGRIYPESVLKKQVEIYKQKIAQRQSYGEMNHPESISIDGSRISHLITDLWWEGKTLVGKMEFAMSPGFVNYGVISCEGDRAANYIRLGYKIGVSSRGVGSVEKDRFSGKYYVQDDFEITCWDIVTDPSTPGSYISDKQDNLKPYIESKSNQKNRIIEGIDNFLNNKIL